MSAPVNPTFVKRKAIFDVSAATRRSEASASTAPAPAAVPLIAAMTGLRRRRMFRMTAPVMRAKRVTVSASAPMSWPMMSCTSPPEQKPFPVPVRITTWTEGSSCRSTNSRSSAP
jgi:hypothetical protein